MVSVSKEGYYSAVRVLEKTDDSKNGDLWLQQHIKSESELGR